MAADARPYKSKEQDGNGNEIILRDQQLVEQSSQTTMASTEYFEIVDVDGRMAKIPKDNMISVVREALGSLLNGLANQTTVAKFLTLNGNTLGASAADTAASVLGDNGLFGGSNETEYQDLNDFKKGIYYNGNVGNPSFNFINYPTSILDSNNTQIAVIAISNNWGGRGYQIAFSKLGLAIRYDSGTWQPWVEKLWNKWPNN